MEALCCVNARFWPDGEPVQMTTDERGRPLRFLWQGERHTVDCICNRWRVDEDWWRGGGRSWRDYIKLTTKEGLLCLLVYDLVRDDWLLVRVYD